MEKEITIGDLLKAEKNKQEIRPLHMIEVPARLYYHDEGTNFDTSNFSWTSVNSTTDGWGNTWNVWPS